MILYNGKLNKMSSKMAFLVIDICEDEKSCNQYFNKINNLFKRNLITICFLLDKSLP